MGDDIEIDAYKGILNLITKFNKETERFEKVGVMNQKINAHRSIGYGVGILQVGGDWDDKM